MSSSRVPQPLRQILNWDVRITKNLVDYAYTNYPKLSDQSSRSFMKLLEWSCHGVPWIGIAFISIYLFPSKQVPVNLLLALLYDLTAVALLKAITRRNRPTDESPPLSLPIDKLSFPSGHATRSVLITCLISATTNSLFLTVLASIWSTLICSSRILMRRHHVLDVLCGMLIGLLEWIFVSIVWAGDDTSRWIGSWIAGAEDEFDGS